MTDAHALDDLIFSYYSGDIQAAELAELNRVIVSDAVAQDRFVAITRQEMALRKVVMGEHALHTEQEHRLPLNARVRSRWRLAGPLAAAAALIAVLGSWFLMRSGESRIVLVAAKGEVRLAPRESLDVSVVPGAVLHGGQTLVTPAGGYARVERGRDTIELGPGTRLALVSSASPDSLDLQAGDVYCTVAKRAVGAGSFSVRTAAGHRAVAIGTGFELGLRGGRTVLAVAEGSVRLETSTTSGVARSGQRLEADGDRILAPAPVLLEEVALWNTEGPRLIRHWTFENGIPADLEIQGRPFCQVVPAHDNEAAELVVPVGKRVGVTPGPLAVPDGPFEVILHCRNLPGSEKHVAVGTLFPPGTPRSGESEFRVAPELHIPDRSRLRMVFSEEVMLSFVDDRIIALQDLPPPSKTWPLYIVFERCAVSSIEIRTLGAEVAREKLPGWMEAGRALPLGESQDGAMAMGNLATARPVPGRQLARWTFENGIPDDFTVLEPSACVLRPEEGGRPATLVIPAGRRVQAMAKSLTIPDEPLEILIETRAEGTGPAQVMARRVNRGELPASRNWSGAPRNPLAPRTVTRMIITGQYEIWMRDNDILGLCEYKAPASGGELLFMLMNTAVESIEIRALAPGDVGKIPGWVREGQALQGPVDSRAARMVPAGTIERAGRAPGPPGS